MHDIRLMFWHFFKLYNYFYTARVKGVADYDKIDFIFRPTSLMQRKTLCPLRNTSSAERQLFRRHITGVSDAFYADSAFW